MKMVGLAKCAEEPSASVAPPRAGLRRETREGEALKKEPGGLARLAAGSEFKLKSASA
jgi:hypothetical protein